MVGGDANYGQEIENQYTKKWLKEKPTMYNPSNTNEFQKIKTIDLLSNICPIICRQ